jgi:hypothetical protein
MRMLRRISPYVLLAALSLTTAPAILQAQDSPKQDVKDAGHDAKNAAKDTGRATEDTAKKRAMPSRKAPIKRRRKRNKARTR